MRILVVVLFALVIAAAVLVVLTVTDDRSADIAAADSIDKSRVEALERELASARQDIERLTAAVESLSADFASLAQRADREGKSTGNLEDGGIAPVPEPVAVAATPEHEEKHVMVPPPEGDLRQIIRDEMEKVEEERRKEAEERRKSWVAEKWEIDEFKELAGMVHSTGQMLGLTDNQKRLYHPIIKEYGERIRSLWKELQDSNPGAEMPELQKLYKEESGNLLNTTRKQVEDILTPEQLKKYRKECKTNSWFK